MKAIVTGLLVFVVCLVLGTGCRYALRRYAPNVYASVFGGASNGTVAVVAGGPLAAATAQPPVAQREVPSPPVGGGEGAGGQSVFATGYVRRGTFFSAVMSDGSNRGTMDNVGPKRNRFERATKYFMDFDGRRYWYRPHNPVMAAPMVPELANTGPATVDQAIQTVSVKPVGP